MKRILQKLAGVKALQYLAVVLAAIYLTFFLNTCLLDMPQNPTLLFGGMLVICSLLVYLKGQLLKPGRETVPLSAAAAVLCLALFQGTFLPAVISLQPEGTGEVCFSDVYLDGQNTLVAGIPVIKNAGWEYRGQYDNYVIYSHGDGIDDPLTLRFDADTIELLFVAGPWAGNVTVAAPAGSAFLDLQAEGDSRLHFTISRGRCYTLFQQCVYNAGAVMVLGFLWSILLALLGRFRHFKPRLPLLMAPVFVQLFLTSPFAPTVFTRLLLAVLTAAAALCPLSERARALLEKYRTRGGRALVVLAALYASFASFGQPYFLGGNTRMHGSREGLLYLLLGALWFIPVIYLLLLGLELLASSRRAGGVPARRRLAFWALLAILCVSQAVVLCSFWPGGFPADCLDHMRQALGQEAISSRHPPLTPIFYRVLLAVSPHAGVLTGAQMFLFALLCAKFLMLGYDAGVRFQVLAVLGVAFLLLPNQVLSGITPVKDYPYMLALLWGTYLLIRLALDKELLQSWWFLVAMPADLFLIAGFRHSGVVPFLAVLLLFAWITVRHFRRVELSLTAVSLASLLLLAAYRGPVFTLLNVSRDTGMSPYAAMLSAAASCVNKDLPLSEQSSAILESVLPLDQWGDFYDRYLGHASYYWGRGDREPPFDPSSITAEEAFTVYLEALIRYPDVVIKDRLDGTDLLWDLRQPSDGFNTKAFYSTYVPDLAGLEAYFPPDVTSRGDVYCSGSPLSEMYLKALRTAPGSVFDTLLWRSGAYLIFLLVLLLFWWGNRMKALLWAAVPLLGSLASLALLLSHQSFRYVYAVQVITVALAFCTVLLRDRERWAAPAAALREPDPLPAAPPGSRRAGL